MEKLIESKNEMNDEEKKLQNELNELLKHFSKIQIEKDSINLQKNSTESEPADNPEKKLEEDNITNTNYGKCIVHVGIAAQYECITCQKSFCFDCSRNHAKEFSAHDFSSYSDKAMKLMNNIDSYLYEPEDLVIDQTMEKSHSEKQSLFVYKYHYENSLQLLKNKFMRARENIKLFDKFLIEKYKEFKINYLDMNNPIMLINELKKIHEDVKKLAINRKYTEIGLMDHKVAKLLKRVDELNIDKLKKVTDGMIKFVEQISHNLNLSKLILAAEFSKQKELIENLNKNETIKDNAFYNNSMKGISCANEKLNLIQDEKEKRKADLIKEALAYKKAGKKHFAIDCIKVKNMVMKIQNCNIAWKIILEGLSERTKGNFI